MLLARGPGVVGRVLGGRQVLQAIVLSSRPRAGAAIDAAHGVSMLALAATSRRHRGPALYSAVAASVWAGLGLRAARR